MLTFTLECRKVQCVIGYSSGNGFFRAGTAFSLPAHLWKYSPWRPPFLLLCPCSFCFKEVTVLIHCTSAGQREDTTATSKTDLFCPCQRTHWTEHCSCSVLLHRFNFFKKQRIDFIFCQEKFLSTVKLLPEKKMITFILIEWLLLFLEQKVISKSCQNLTYLNLQLCKLDAAFLLLYFNAFIGILFKISSI